MVVTVLRWRQGYLVAPLMTCRSLFGLCIVRKILSMVYISSGSPIVVFIWGTANLTRWIQDNLQGHTIYYEIRFLLSELVGSLADSLTCWLIHWQTDWSCYLVVLIKDSVGTNWMLSGEGTLPASLLPALHSLQVNELSVLTTISSVYLLALLVT